MKKNIQRFISSWVFISIITHAANAQITINTIAIPPVSPFLNQIFSQAGTGVRARLNYFKLDPTYSNGRFRVYGKIERLSPSPFTIELRNDTTLGAFIEMKMMIPPSPLQHTLTKPELEQAFGYFDVANLIYNGITPGELNGKLPDGVYNICFTVQVRKKSCCDVSVCSCQAPYESVDSRCASFTIITCTQPLHGMLVNTIAAPPLNPLIAQSISLGNVKSSIQFNNPPTCSTQVKLFGKIQRISPSPFSIELDPNYPQQAATINPGVTQLTSNQMMGAFNNFNESNLLVAGVNLASIKDASNRIKLPDGDYRICFYARYLSGVYASDPDLGCGSFKICNKAGGAPQFTQPVNNANINSEISIIQAVSPVIFSWTPPQSTCGLPPSGYTYDLDIWELYPNQTVTDAVNNPYVFRKTSLPSTTFLLDINLNKDVLKQGKRYAMRVRAVSINFNSPVEIENDGYSRIEAFQYGGSLITQNGVPDPHDYFIQFEERKSILWDDIYKAYQRHRQSDTLVPIKEYIAFVLTQNGIAYSLDAIELFLALNPELADVKHVKISHAPTLPVFPPVSSNDQKSFEKEHAVNLESDKLEENKFLKYLDTLNTYKKTPDKAAQLINDLISHLNSVKMQISSVDRVTVNFINSVLSELLYELRLYPRNLNTVQYNQLQQLVTTVRELTAESTKTAFLFYKPLFNSHTAGPNESTSQDDHEIKNPEYLPVTIEEQLLPFDVIVWRTGTVAPYKPVLDAPDLKASFRIFYILSKLYNHKNPEVNATSSSRLASTIRVSLPSNTMFSFWSLNMVNHKTTSAKDVDLRDVFKNSMKREPSLKRPSVVIKVD